MFHMCFSFFIFKGFIVQAAIGEMSVCIAEVSTSGSFIFYMGEDHSLPFCVFKNVLSCFYHHFGAVSHFFFSSLYRVDWEKQAVKCHRP